MIRSIRYFCAEETDPRANLALEEYLLHTVGADECILYLWQNQKTVVVGRNQNCWKECRLAALERDGGFLTRRLSGGGAVYHDLGNLNFTFLVHEQHYDLARQLDVILRAVRNLGIAAEKTGRNDLTADGRKFSGNAFYASGRQRYHHGTILLQADMERLTRYLNVAADKLQTKGVASAAARVVNLAALNPEITVDRMRQRLLESFGAVYGLTPIAVDRSELDANRIAELTQKFSSWDWTYGRPIPFTYEISKRFAWGDVQLQIRVNRGRVAEIAVYSDAMDGAWIGRLAPALRGCLFSSQQLRAAVAKIPAGDDSAAGMSVDIQNFLLEHHF